MVILHKLMIVIVVASSCGRMNAPDLNGAESGASTDGEAESDALPSDSGIPYDSSSNDGGADLGKATCGYDAGDECGQCSASFCCRELSACKASADCRDHYYCVNRGLFWCRTDSGGSSLCDGGCNDVGYLDLESCCAKLHPDGAAEQQAWGLCAESQCGCYENPF